MKILFVAPEEESMAVEYLSAAAKLRGHTTALAFDPCLFRDQYIFTAPGAARAFDHRPLLVEQAKNFAPDLVAFSVVSAYRHWAAELSLVLRKATGAKVVWGGHHVTAAIGPLLKDGFADYYVVGEGDPPFVELLDALEADRDPSKIANLAGLAAGRSFQNPARPLITDLDELPIPDKSLYYNESFGFRKAYCITASRGCPFGCRFCHHSNNREMYGARGYYRWRSVESVIGELVAARENFPYSFVRFLDDLFPPTAPGWLEEFAERYPREVGAPWWSYAYPDRLRPEMIPLLKKSGCVEVAFGVQTIDVELRRKAASRIGDNDHLSLILRTLADYDIQVSTSNIVNLPGETDEHLMKLLRFYNDNRPTKVLTVPLMYLPGTGITKMAYEHGQIDREQYELVEKSGEVLYSHELPQFENRSRLMRRMPTLMALLPLVSKQTGEKLLTADGGRSLPELPFWFIFLLNQVLVLLRGGSRDRTPLQRFFARYLDYGARAILDRLRGRDHRAESEKLFAPTIPTASTLYQKPDAKN